MSIATAGSGQRRIYKANTAYDANRRRLVHGPLQPMENAGLLRSLWRRLTGS